MTSDELTPTEQMVLAHVKSGSAFQLLQLLAEEDSAVQEEIADKSFSLGLRVAGGMQRSIKVVNGRISPVDNSVSGSGVIFRFPTYSQLNNLLSGRKSRMIPIIKTFKAGGIISSFKSLTSRIPVYMNAEGTFLEDNFTFITRLLICAALRGIKEVAENDPYVSDRVAGIPDGIIALHVEGCSELEARIKKHGGSFTVLTGRDETIPNAALTFNSPETAYNLFTGKINAVVALGTSDVKIRGRIPMIQGLFPILDRLSFYMAIK
ncbi:MAG: hypothetical protein PQJ61_12535 [Spirochaetales bacterium]|uniref:SCP2 domain-containing protein n=1 Tax=Candidatus Thalassospirochaeta sargassi TaxID=3119039 RepID=A0AAJ1MPC8_9SPIO|nr:hypothetical protein [Spirochaetales bacterium]